MFRLDDWLKQWIDKLGVTMIDEIVFRLDNAPRYKFILCNFKAYPGLLTIRIIDDKNVYQEQRIFDNFEIAQLWLDNFRPGAYYARDVMAPLMSKPGLLLTIKEFREHVLDGCMNDFDGVMRLCNADGKFSMQILIETFMRHRSFPKLFTHVAWYNK